MRRIFKFTVEVSYDVEGDDPTTDGMEGLLSTALESLKDDLNDYYDDQSGLDRLSRPDVESIKLSNVRPA